jgi:hypothetical protein
MDIEVVLVLDVITSELAETAGRNISIVPRRASRDVLCLVPSDNIADADLPESGHEGYQGKDNGCKHGLPFIEAFEESWLLLSTSASVTRVCSLQLPYRVAIPFWPVSCCPLVGVL